MNKSNFELCCQTLLDEFEFLPEVRKWAVRCSTGGAFPEPRKSKAELINIIKEQIARHSIRAQVSFIKKPSHYGGGAWSDNLLQVRLS